jgi:hypothetical protein
MPEEVELPRREGMPKQKPSKRVSLLAAFAFVIAWMPPLFVPAFVLALVARKEIREHQDSMSGKGLTTSAIFLAALTPVMLVMMNIAYRKNLENHKLALEGAQAALSGQLSNSFLRSLPGSSEERRKLQADIQRLESNTPSFFNPFGW